VVKPHPRQARILRALAEDQDILISLYVYFAGTDREWSRVEFVFPERPSIPYGQSGWREDADQREDQRKEAAKMSVSSLRSMIDAGWLEATKTPENALAAPRLGQRNCFRLSAAGLTLFQSLGPGDFIPRPRPAPAMTAKEVRTFVRRKYGVGEKEVYGRSGWMLFDELHVPDFDDIRRIDVWAFNLWRSRGWKAVAHEIKVSRGDFLSEVRSAKKRAQALRCSDEFYFVTPAGLVHPDEVPPECGLMEVQKGGRVYVVRKAPKRDERMDGPPWNLFVALANRLVRVGMQEPERMRWDD
jgi:hypothetical protein